MKTFFYQLIFFAFMLSWNTLPGQNNALDFDGYGDYITLTPIAGFPANSDFTVEMRFLSTATGGNGSCSGDFRRLFALGTGRFEVGECMGFLSLFSSGTGILQSPIDIRGAWHCISVVRSGDNVVTFLDGNPVPQLTSSGIGTLNSTLFRLGHWPGGTSTQFQDWQGMIEEVKLWKVALPPTQLTACSPCLLSGSEPNLVAYWQFDQGAASGNNTGISQAIDATANGNNGLLHPFPSSPDAGFDLMGSDGNFVSSGAPLVYPNYNNLTLLISDPLQTVGLVAICDGDPVHFTLSDINGNTPQPSSGVTVNWEYSDGGPFTPISPPPNGFQFVVPPNGATAISCPTNNVGYVDRDYRAVITVTNTFGTCVYTTPPAQLRICCKISPATLQVSTNFLNDLLCDGDVVTFNVSLNSPDPFLTIAWCYNGSDIGLANQANFTYTTVVNSPKACITAKLSNCVCPPVTVEKCFNVDPQPQCGSIIGWPVPATLTQISTTPWMTYEICPGDHAAVGMTIPAQFINCNPQWQYSFGDPFQIPLFWTWHNLGSSNSIQNTNILPAHYSPPWPPNQQSIFYRIQCNPLSSPSGCDPCNSNIIEIRLKPPISKPVIAAVPPTQTICKGDAITLFASNDPGTQTTWYCNGEIIGTGPSVSVSKQACYWAEATDGCYTEKSEKYCLTVCTATAIIKCPEDNPCVIPNVPVTLSGLLSWSTCSGIVQYDWEVEDFPNGPINFFSGPTVTFTPPATGSIVTLCVTDPFGCTHCTQAFIKPCQP